MVEKKDWKKPELKILDITQITNNAQSGTGFDGVIGS